MTREEAIRVLERVAHTESKWPGTEDTLEALDMGISALRQQEQLDKVSQSSSQDKPLTLDELLQMNGEPVWIVEYPDWGHWELSADAGDYVAERDYDCYGMKHDDPAGRYGLHKLGWLAYRKKPEEGTV